MDHSIGTLSPCAVIDIPRAGILELLERPALAKSLLMATLVDEATLRKWIVNVSGRKAEVRIAHLFCELLARLNAIGLTTGNSFELPVTQAELGDTVGLSTVHIDRSLQQLRNQDLIVLKSGKLHIPDVGRLVKMSGFRSNYLHLADVAASDASVTLTDARLAETRHFRHGSFCWVEDQRRRGL